MSRINVIGTMLALLVVFILLNSHLANGTEPANDFFIEKIGGECQECDLSYKLLKIQFVGPDKGWASGMWLPKDGSAWMTVLHTEDGGRKWKQVNLVQTPYSFSETFDFISENNGWFVWDNKLGDVRLFKTINSGADWQEIGKSILTQVKFFDENKGVGIEGDGPYFSMTSDGGVTWVRKNKLFFSHNLEKMFFIDPQVGWIAGEQNKKTTVIKTDNGGEAWTVSELPVAGSRPHDLFFLDKNTGWIIVWDDTGSSLFYTGDGGATWKQHPDTSFQGKGIYLNAIRFISEKVGFAFYENGKKNKGYLLYTNDGGLNWKKYSMTDAVKYCQVFQGELWCSAGMNVIKVRLAKSEEIAKTP